MIPELPMLARTPACPAALVVAGAVGCQQGVVCRAMQRDQAGTDGLGMTAGRTRSVREGTGGVFMTVVSDPSTVTAFCHGDAVPVVTDEDGQARASYTSCPVWQAEKERIAAGRDELAVEPEPEPVAMGVSSVDAIDPWAQARRDLDELAPAR